MAGTERVVTESGSPDEISQALFASCTLWFGCPPASCGLLADAVATTGAAGYLAGQGALSAVQ